MATTDTIIIAEQKRRTVGIAQIAAHYAPYFPPGYRITSEMWARDDHLLKCLQRDIDAGWARRDFERDHVVYDGPTWQRTGFANAMKAPPVHATEKEQDTPTPTQSNSLNPVLLLTGDQA